MIAIFSDWTQAQAGQVVLIGAAVGAFVKWVIVPVYRAGRTLVEVAEFIRHELQENSGRSQKDYAIRNDRRVEYLFKIQGIEMPDDMKSPPPDGTHHY